MSDTRQRSVTLTNSSGGSMKAVIVATATDSHGVQFARLRASMSAGGRFLGYIFPTYRLVDGAWVRSDMHVPPKAISAIAAAAPGDRIKASGRWWDVGDPQNVPATLAY